VIVILQRKNMSRVQLYFLTTILEELKQKCFAPLGVVYSSSILLICYVATQYIATRDLRFSSLVLFI